MTWESELRFPSSALIVFDIYTIFLYKLIDVCVDNVVIYMELCVVIKILNTRCKVYSSNWDILHVKKINPHRHYYLTQHRCSSDSTNDVRVDEPKSTFLSTTLHMGETCGFNQCTCKTISILYERSINVVTSCYDEGTKAYIETPSL